MGTTPPKPLLQPVPLLLLPVRLETRFRSPDWLFRVVPDQVHLDTHRRALTSGEVAAGREYWLRCWVSKDAGSRAWSDLTTVMRPARAAWVIRALTPMNPRTDNEPVFPDVEIDDRRLGPLLAPQALPTVWRFVGYDDQNAKVLDKLSKPVARDLAMSLPVDSTPPEGDADPDAVSSFLRWTLDFDQAEKAGMAIRVTPADVGGHSLSSGFIRVVVVGIDREHTPAQGTAVAASLLEAQASTVGVRLHDPGTSTNSVVIDTSAAGPLVTPEPGEPQLDRSGALLIERALGLPESVVLRTESSARSSTDALAKALISPIWSVIFEPYLRKYWSVSASTAGKLADFATLHLRPHGTFPILRIGRQPLAIGTVVAPGRVPDGTLERRVRDVTDALRPVWRAAAIGLPDLVSPDGGLSLDEAIVQAMRRSPWSTSFHVRAFLGQPVADSLPDLRDHVATQDVGRSLAKELLGAAHVPLQGAFADPKSEPAGLPAIGIRQDDGSYDLGFVEDLKSALVDKDGVRRQAISDATPVSILHAVLRIAALSAIDAAIADQDQRYDEVFEREVATDRATISVDRSTTPRARSKEIDPATKQARTVLIGAELRSIVARPVALDRQARSGPGMDRLVKLYRCLQTLPNADAHVLEAVFCSLIDASSHRLDAWISASANAVLHRARTRQSSGLGLGGYCWVDDLRPSTPRTSHGAYLTPSLDHATTAGILRSGHLANDADDAAFSIDLHAARAQLASEMITAVREGYPLALLLGYHLERDLRERGFGRLIRWLRQQAPFRPPETGTTRPGLPRDVVDGAVAVQQAASIPTRRQDPNEQAALTAALSRVADLYDAVADLLIAEGTYQLVRGRPEAARSTFDALRLQTPLPELEVTRTPRHRDRTTFRVAIALPDAVPPGWSFDPDVAGRAIADPYVDAWIGHVLGPPATWRFRTRVGEAAKVITLADLAISPLECVEAAASDPSRPSELDSMIERAARAALGQLTGASVTIERGATVDRLGYREFVAIASAIRRLLTTCRPSDASTWARPDDTSVALVKSEELSTRANRLMTRARRVLADAVEALAAPVSADLIADVLESMARLAVPGCRPTEATDDDLRERLVSSTADLRSRAEQADRATDPAEQLRLLLGGGRPLATANVPAALIPDPTQTVRLVGRDRDSLAGWLIQRAKVRDGVDKLFHVISAAEARIGSTGVRDVMVSQLPGPGPGRWIGKTVTRDQNRPDTSIVVHDIAPDGRPTRAALVVDDWSEAVPSPEHVAGVSLHAPSPSSQAPQAALLGVLPSPEAQWLPDTVLGTVLEAIDLATIRGVHLVDLDVAGAVLPMFHLSVDETNEFPSTKFPEKSTQGVFDG